MKLTRTLLFSIALSLIVLVGWSNNTFALSRNNSDNTGNFSASNIFTVLSGLIFGSAENSVDRQSHSVSLNKAVVSKVSDSNIVVTMEASGDMRGSLSLILNRDASNNSITGGDWALVASHIEDVDAHEESLNESEPHGGELLINNGTLRGSITGGSITLNDEGAVTSLGAIQMSVVSGSLTYSEVSAGDGLANGLGLNDVQTSSGTLTLNF